MERIPDHSILKFNPDTLQCVRAEFNLDKPGRIQEAIDILEDWVKKQEHFVKKDFSRDYLEKTIITTKGSVERAKTRIDRLCTFRTLAPNFFQSLDKTRLQKLSEMVSHAHLPKLTSDNYRVYAMKLLSDDIDSSDIFDYYRNIIILSEYIKAHDYCSGFVLVLDYRDMNPLTISTKLNPSELRQALAVLTDGYGMRLKGIHMVTPSKMIDAMVSIFKQVLSTKLGSRIFIHKTLDSLYEQVPKSILPAELEGEEKSLKELNQQWIKEITSDEHQQYLEEMNKATTNEAYRHTDKFNEQYLGMPGSFRTLSVD